MNGNGTEDTGVLDDIEDVTESDELEMDEAVSESESAEFLPLPFPGLPFGGGRARRPQVARAQSYFGARPQSVFVTQSQLQSALGKVRNDVARNARAITALNTRANTLQATATRHGQALTRQAKVNERQTRDLRAGLKKLQDNSLMMFLLTRPKTSTTLTTPATVGGATLPAGNKILIQPEKDNSLLLMLALSGGLGGSDGASGGGDSNMLLMVLALSGGL